MKGMKLTRLDGYKLFHEGLLAFVNAEQQGMCIDVEYCKTKHNHLHRKIEYLEEKFYNTKMYKHWSHVMKKPNIYSNWQLAKYLYDIRKIQPPKLTESGKGSTDEETLSQINLPEVQTILEIRKLKKIRDTYLNAFIREETNGRIHPFFNLHTVKTYRSSSDKPNFQNIPKRDKEAMKICRRAIIPSPGNQLLEVDYSGIEVKIGVCYHKDPTMKKYMENKHTDMHGDMAKQIFKLDTLDKSIPGHKRLRDATKNSFVFPQFYGDYYVNCAENLACKWGELPKTTWKKGQGIEVKNGVFLSDHLRNKGIKSYKSFEKHIQQVEDDFWGRRFSRYQEWKDSLWRSYQKKGYVDLYTGFRCSDIMRRNEAINAPIQGSAFHCLLWSFIELDKISRRENWKTKLIGQIHDAILFDVYPPELSYITPKIHEVMCESIRKKWQWIITDLEVEMDICEPDAPWSEKKAFMWGEGRENEGLE